MIRLPVNTTPPCSDSRPVSPPPPGRESLFNLVGKFLTILSVTALLTFAAWNLAAWAMGLLSSGDAP